jgi:hypothetical protein
LGAQSKYRRSLAIGAVVLALVAGALLLPPNAAVQQLRVVAVPEIRNASVRLRVAHAVNPRFRSLDDAQLKALLNAASATAKLHFGIEVTYEGEPVRVAVEELFRVIPSHIAKSHWKTIEMVRKGEIDRDRLIESYRQAMLEDPVSLAEFAAYVQPLAGEGIALANRGQLATFLADHHSRQFRLLRGAATDDGMPLVDDGPFNEWSFWDSLGYGDLPFDVVVTNQPILSLEYHGTGVHVALRGGITLGTTLYTRKGKYGAAVVWSTFPFSARDAAFAKLRGGDTYAPDEVARLAGILMTHELGHMLFHLGHPFGNPACIMSPVPLLRFREKAAALDPQKCPMKTDAAMTPGAIRLQYYE